MSICSISSGCFYCVFDQMHWCSYSRERASEAFSKRGSKQQLLTLTQTHRQPPVQGWRRRSGWALRAIEKTDASVPAHEDERAARGRVAFAYATILQQFCFCPVLLLRSAACSTCLFCYVHCNHMTLDSEWHSFFSCPACENPRPYFL